jgi:hypothetical protein
MSQSNNNPTFDPFDPTGMLKQMRDANTESMSKVMTDLVNTEAYAESTGAMLDAWLTTSGPFRKAMDKSMAQTMAQLNMPTRDDITRLAGQLTNIEMRLDDLDARLDEQSQSNKQQTTT